MSIKSDKWISWHARYYDLISPFVEESKGDISYGVSSYGYDVRCDNEFKVLNKDTKIIDPKSIKKQFTTVTAGKAIEIPPHDFVLAKTYEYIKMPRNAIALCVGKSTYARCGLVLNTTPIEPEWEGYITLELSNTTSLPILVYAYEGIAQLLFFSADEECNVSYADRDGKYNKQIGVQEAKANRTP